MCVCVCVCAPARVCVQLCILYILEAGVTLPLFVLYTYVYTFQSACAFRTVHIMYTCKMTF